jgi:hypothetical protein
MAEKQVLNSILQYYGMFPNKIRLLRYNAGKISITDDKKGKTRYFIAGVKGAPDIIGLLKGGAFVGIECKYGKNKLSPHQETFLNDINKLGAITIVAYSLDDVRKVLDPLMENN